MALYSQFYFSNLVDRYKLSAILWCALRCKEGKVDVNINDLASTYNVDVKTVRKHLNNTFFFRSCYRLSKGVFRVYLVGINVIRQHTKLGVKWECLTTNTKELIQQARLATTLGLQKRLRKARLIQNKKNKKLVKTVKHVDMFNSDGTPLINATGVIFASQKNNKTTMFMGSSMDISGATHNVISKELDRHPITIRRALSKVSKIRMYKFSPEYYIHHSEAAFVDMEEGGNTRGSYYKYRNYTYKACPNVYYPSIDLLGYYS